MYNALNMEIRASRLKNMRILISPVNLPRGISVPSVYKSLYKTPTLLLGEGNFSFTSALAWALGTGGGMVATSDTVASEVPGLLPLTKLAHLVPFQAADPNSNARFGKSVKHSVSNRCFFQLQCWSMYCSRMC